MLVYTKNEKNSVLAYPQRKVFSFCNIHRMVYKLAAVYFSCKTGSFYTSTSNIVRKLNVNMFKELDTSSRKLSEEISTYAFAHSTEFATCVVSETMTTENFTQRLTGEFRSRCMSLVTDKLHITTQKWFSLVFTSSYGDLIVPVTGGIDKTEEISYRRQSSVRTASVESIAVNKFFCNVIHKPELSGAGNTLKSWFNCNHLPIDGACSRLYSKFDRKLDQTFIRFDVVTQLEMKNAISDFSDLFFDFKYDTRNISFFFILYTLLLWYMSRQKTNVMKRYKQPAVY